jgi:hypothetical protein
MVKNWLKAARIGAGKVIAGHVQFCSGWYVGPGRFGANERGKKTRADRPPFAASTVNAAFCLRNEGTGE